jgi:long-chain acyl-CoA synthetase
MAMRSIIKLFEESVKKYSGNIFLWQHNGSEYKGSTYEEVYRRVISFAAGLMKIGLEPGDRVMLLAEGRNDWVVSELAILFNGAINVPLSVKINETDEIKFRLQHSGSKFAITTGRQIQKVLNVANAVSNLELIISLDPVQSGAKNLRYIEDIIEEGNLFLKNNKQDFDQRKQGVDEHAYANICYTSGTTADPKGIILTHRNYTANVEQVSTLYTIPSWYTTLLILPWDHSFAHTCGIYAKMKYGASLAAIQSGSTPMETLKNIPKNIREIKPVFLLSVPSLAKNFRKNIEGAIQEKGGIAEKLFRNALNIAYRYNGNGWDRGKGAKKILWPLYKLYDIILFRKIRAGFGGRLKFFVGGGALLDIELQRFFFAIGIPMFQGYGLTEAAPVISSNNMEKVKMGSSGTIAGGLELKICDDDGKEMPAGERGEIVVRGENVMQGYWENERATKETLKNGWLHTGDLGYLDNDGFLYVLGRFKSLLIADDGEKFSPEGIEEAFADKTRLIDQAMLHNNQKPYSVCLVFPNSAAIKKLMQEESIPIGQAPEFVARKIEEELAKYRKGGPYEDLFPQRWLPAATAILSEGFTEENRLMNSTLKIVRPRITAHYQDLLDYLYMPGAKNIANPRNIEAIKKLLGDKPEV